MKYGRQWSISAYYMAFAMRICSYSLVVAEWWLINHLDTCFQDFVLKWVYIAPLLHGLKTDLKTMIGQKTKLNKISRNIKQMICSSKLQKVFFL